MHTRFLSPLLLVLPSAWAGAQAASSTPAHPPAQTAAAPAVQAAPTTATAPATASPVRSHICLAPSSVQIATGTAADAMAAVRAVFTSYLTGPTLEVAPLSSRLPAQARQEAKADNCPYVLFTTLKQVHKTSGGGSSLISRMAGSAVQQGSYAVGGVTSSAGGQVAVNAAGGAAGAAATNYGSQTKPDDELTLSTQLESGDGKVLVNMTDKRKAQSVGEDLLTPLVEKAATAVANAVTPTK
jgi:hypothetical protein